MEEDNFDFNKMSVKDKILFMIVKEGKSFDTDLINELNIDEQEFYKAMIELQNEGFLNAIPIEETILHPNMENIEEIKLTFKILTYICRKGICRFTELISRYNLDKNDLLNLLKPFQQDKLIELINDNKNSNIIATNELKNYLKDNIIEEDDIPGHIYDIKNDKAERQFLTPETFFLLKDISNIIKTEGNE